ncbi:MAG: CHAT domain-containing protein [Nanoarchaeota archaeon]|nr:CHAT domain-containing protein [Nanoarchaeota archaeon]
MAGQSTAILTIWLLEFAGESKYVYSLNLPAKEHHPYIPTKMTNDLKPIRDSLISSINEYYVFLRSPSSFPVKVKAEAEKKDCEKDLMDTISMVERLKMAEDQKGVIEAFKDLIGHKIKTNLEANDIFEQIWNDPTLTHLIIQTNDNKIPWEWAYNDEEEKDDKKFLCERFAVGKVFSEKTTEFHAFMQKSEKSFGTAKKVKQNLTNEADIILFYDNRKDLENFPDKKFPGKQKDIEFLELVEEEINEIEKIFKNKKFKKIHKIDGQDKNFAVRFNHYFNPKYLRQCQLIHFSGHLVVGKGGSAKIIVKGNKLGEHREIGPEEIGASQSSRKNLLMSGPLVFLNGCQSGEIEDIWEQGNNLSTEFMRLGASGCICTYLPIRDDIARDFAVYFYEKYTDFAEPTTVGQAIVCAREKTKEKYKDTLSWLFFTFYGNPEESLIPLPEKEVKTFYNQMMLEEYKEENLAARS